MQRTSLQKLCGLLATTAIALVLIGCNGKAGQNGVNGTPGAPGSTYVNTVNAAQLSQAEWSSLNLTGAISTATVSGKPTVTFTIKNELGTPVSGLTAANMDFAIAKLIPGSGSAPSRWVSYNVVSTPVAPAVAVPGFAEAEHAGTLKDNLDGTYTYTFALDISRAKAYADAATYDASHIKSDLDDLTYDATLVHRLIATVGGKFNGSGPSVNTSANLAYDFIPATGKAAAATDPSRVIADLSGCNSCHSKLSMHADFFPAIQDTRLCVVCHTDQLKYGSGDSVPVDGTTNVRLNGYYGSTQKLMGRALADFPNMIHHIHAGQDLYFQGYNQFGVMYNDVAYPQQKNCSKCHSASTPQGTNWNMVPSRKACGGCHDNVDFANGVILGSGAGHSVQLTDANCSATGCHTAAAIPVYHTFNDQTALNPAPPAGLGNFTYDLKSVTVNGSNQPVVTFRISLNGTPVTSFPALSMVNNVANGRTVADPTYQPIPNFVGGPSIVVALGAPQDGIKPNDFNVRLSSSLIGLLTPVGQPGNTGILSATADADGYWTATLTGDPIGQPVKYTGWVQPATGGSAFSAVLPSPIFVPAGATNITGAIYGGFTQIDQAAYPYTFQSVTVAPNVSATGGLLRVGQFKTLLATVVGNVARRTIVDSNKCNSCHDQLGTKPNFHGGATSFVVGGGAVGAGPRNEATACSMCHTVNQTSSAWSANASTFIHGIHSATKRTVPFTWHAPDPDDGYAFLLYPGVLNQCEQCHVPGSYDFSATANAAAIPNLLYTTVGTGIYATPASVSQSPYVQLSPKNYGNGFSYTSAGATVAKYTKADGTSVAAHVAAAGGEIVPADPATLVSSPMTAACASCHDSTSAVSHMKLNGGFFYQPRSLALQRDASNNLVTVEACLTCHGSGAAYDIKAVHQVQ